MIGEILIALSIFGGSGLLASTAWRIAARFERPAPYQTPTFGPPKIVSEPRWVPDPAPLALEPDVAMSERRIERRPKPVGGEPSTNRGGASA